MELTRALLVQRRNRSEPNLISEFKALATTAGYSVIGCFDIVSPPSAKYGLRSGKVDEIATWLEVEKADVVLFSPSLKSGQLFRLMEKWDLEVRDRTQVILEIFDRHASTPQAKLQIEQARLRYELPFERHQIRVRLQKEHTGDRPITDQVGAGEDILSKHMMEIRRRIADIDSKLQKIADSQSLKKKKRSSIGFVEVALAGYTNAGKSTLHNTLTSSGVEIADQLFTTLSTKTARLESLNRQVVISDSVGFISDIPESLMRAFNTTLMEISDADAILLVVDASDAIEEMERKIATCLDTFADIGANGIPVVMVLNKIDLIDEDDLKKKELHFAEHSNSLVSISAKEHIGIKRLLEEVEHQLPEVYTYSIQLPYGDQGMSILSWLHEVGEVKSKEFRTDYMEIMASLSIEIAQKLVRKSPEVVVARVIA